MVLKFYVFSIFIFFYVILSNKCNTVQTVKLWNIVKIYNKYTILIYFKMQFISVKAKLNFQQPYSDSPFRKHFGNYHLCWKQLYYYFFIYLFCGNRGALFYFSDNCILNFLRNTFPKNSICLAFIYFIWLSMIFNLLSFHANCCSIHIP